MQTLLFLTLGLLGLAIGLPLSPSADNMIVARQSAPEKCPAGFLPVSVDGNVVCQALEGPTSPQCPKGSTAVYVKGQSVCATIQQ
jgi:hypothetical protein